MLKIINFIINSVNKKTKKKFLNKIFEIIKIFLLSQNIFESDDYNNLNLKQIEIIYKLTDIIFIENNGKIKLEKKLFELIDKYNSINEILIKRKHLEKSYLKLENNLDECNSEKNDDSASETDTD